MQQKQDNTIAIIGIVIGGLGLIFSMIPCIGVLGFFPGIIGLILGLVAFFKARDNGDRKTLSIIALVISSITMILAAFWYFTIGSFASDFDQDVKTYQNCDSLKIDMELLASDLKRTVEEMEDNKEGASVLSNFSQVASMTTKLSKLEEQSKQLGCNLSISKGETEEIDTLSIEN